MSRHPMVVISRIRAFSFHAGLALIFSSHPRMAAAEAPVEARLEQLAEQNRRLEEQVRTQQRQIEELRAMVSGLKGSGERQDRAINDLRTQVADEPAAVRVRSAAPGREVRVSGEAGFGFFRSGGAGASPNSEFHADDGKVFVEAAVMKNVYLFAGMELVTREASDEYFHVGDLYADFENISDAWGGPTGLLNLRVGRFAIPFGEEYQRRNVVDNALITHSLSDIWGTDEGVEIFGALDRFSYVLAVQNGGHKTLRDYNSDKAVIARIGFDPTEWAHVSASAMRTGDLTVAGDAFSEVWIGNGFFRALGPGATTSTFSASLMQLDASLHWKGTDLRAAGGRARFDDNDRSADNSRRLRFYLIEVEQRLVGKWYGASRWSELKAPGGYPLVGQGDFGTYMYRSPLTTDLRRLSVGGGYRFGPALVWKAEYGFERGHLVTGARRDQEDLFSTEVALRF